MVLERMEPIRRIVERAVERGEIPPIDIETALFIHGPLMARLLLSAEPLRSDDVDALLPLLVRGLQG